ncbi:MAG: DUF4363 family protein [Clostridia bacterium]|nr:DUF4363 family protein [Clostridia bacterium]
MKSFIGAMLIFAILLVSGFAFNSCLNSTSDRLLRSCENISGKVKTEDFEAAYKSAEELSKYIDGKKPLISSILDHGSIDDIETEISELLGYTENKDKINSIVSLKKLAHMFEHLPENYSVKLQNIL